MLADREVIAVSPRPGSRTAVLPLRPVKFSPCTLRIQVLTPYPACDTHSLLWIHGFFLTLSPLLLFSSFLLFLQTHVASRSLNFFLPIILQ